MRIPESALAEASVARRLKRSGIALKLLGGAGLTTLVVLLGLRFLAGIPWWTVVAGSLLVGAVTYLLAYRFIVPRIELAYSILREIRQHRFDNLEAARIPKGDELSALIWQVYRTGGLLEREIQELKKIENYRRDYLGNVSHELRTPIFAIEGFAETLLDGALDDERVRRTFVEKIYRNSVRLRNLARDLSDITSIETGQMTMRPGSFKLQGVAREVVESLGRLAEEKNVALGERVPTGLPAVYGDKERIRQVLINLVENAIRYSESGDTVDILATMEGPNEIRVAVRDTGIGISAEHIPRLTERFFRVDHSRSRNQGGTGLGLAIVKHILSAHDRKLEISSIPGEGSTFWFTLPLAETVGAPEVVSLRASPAASAE